MHAAKQKGLDRIGVEGSYVIVPMDHGITMGPTDGLRRLGATVDSVTRGGATGVVTHRGLSAAVHRNTTDAGYICHLNGSTQLGPDVQDKRRTATVEDAIRNGADAVSFHINVGSDSEPEQIEDLATVVSDAGTYNVPVLAMAYARGPDIDRNSDDYPMQVAHAARVAEELGADIVKVPYTGSKQSFEKVTKAVTVPVVIAGGSKGSDEETLTMVSESCKSGASGVSMGRSIFQHESPEAMAKAVYNVVVHGASTSEAQSPLQ